MQTESHMDQWGGIILELRGESAHENTLLELLGTKRMAEHVSSESGSTASPSATTLTFTFREWDKASIEQTQVAGKAMVG